MSANSASEHKSVLKAELGLQGYRATGLISTSSPLYSEYDKLRVKPLRGRTCGSMALSRNGLTARYRGRRVKPLRGLEPIGTDLTRRHSAALGFNHLIATINHTNSLVNFLIQKAIIRELSRRRRARRAHGGKKENLFFLRVLCAPRATVRENYRIFLYVLARSGRK